MVAVCTTRSGVYMRLHIAMVSTYTCVNDALMRVFCVFSCFHQIGVSDGVKQFSVMEFSDGLIVLIEYYV